MNHAEKQPLIVSRSLAARGHREPLLARIFGRLIVWHERQSQRHRLRDLDERALRDLGLTRSDVEREARKPFWRA